MEEIFDDGPLRREPAPVPDAYVDLGHAPGLAPALAEVRRRVRDRHAGETSKSSGRDPEDSLVERRARVVSEPRRRRRGRTA